MNYLVVAEIIWFIICFDAGVKCEHACCTFITLYLNSLIVNDRQYYLNAPLSCQLLSTVVQSLTLCLVYIKLCHFIVLFMLLCLQRICSRSSGCILHQSVVHPRFYMHHEDPQSHVGR